MAVFIPMYLLMRFLKNLFKDHCFVGGTFLGIFLIIILITRLCFIISPSFYLLYLMIEGVYTSPAVCFIEGGCILQSPTPIVVEMLEPGEALQTAVQKSVSQSNLLLPDSESDSFAEEEEGQGTPILFSSQKSSSSEEEQNTLTLFSSSNNSFSEEEQNTLILFSSSNNSFSEEEQNTLTLFSSSNNSFSEEGLGSGEVSTCPKSSFSEGGLGSEELSSTGATSTTGPISSFSEEKVGGTSSTCIVSSEEN